MSDYGADPNPDEDNLHMTSYGYSFTMAKKIQGDQYTINGDLQVLKFCDGTRTLNLKLLVKPSEIAGT